MTPTRRRETFQPKRDRREVVVAVLAVVAILAVTGVLLWLFRPDDGSDSVPSSPTITQSSTPPEVTSLPTDTTVPTTPAP